MDKNNLPNAKKLYRCIDSFNPNVGGVFHRNYLHQIQRENLATVEEDQAQKELEEGYHYLANPVRRRKNV